jgi:hypothetical protein
MQGSFDQVGAQLDDLAVDRDKSSSFGESELRTQVVPERGG